MLVISQYWQGWDNKHSEKYNIPPRPIFFEASGHKVVQAADVAGIILDPDLRSSLMNFGKGNPVSDFWNVLDTDRQKRLNQWADDWHVKQPKKQRLVDTSPRDGGEPSWNYKLTDE